MRLVSRYKPKDNACFVSTGGIEFPMEIPALRKIAQAQFLLQDYEPAQISWNQIIKIYPNDQHANHRLSTIFSRLAEKATSKQDQLRYIAMADEPVARLIKNSQNSDSQPRADAHAMQARNYKSKWIASWKELSDLSERQADALKSPWLRRAVKEYARAFNEDLNHYYSGINALSLLKILLSLGEIHQDIWEKDYVAGCELEDEKKKLRSWQNDLISSINFSLSAARKRTENSCKKDDWLNTSIADLAFITGSNPERVASLYRNCLIDLSSFYKDSIRRQLLIYHQLGVLTENVEKALLEFDATPEVKKIEFLLFFGNVRGESHLSSSDAIKRAIFEKVTKIKDKDGNHGEIFGLAGCASEEDVLFHEVCKEQDIKTKIMLPLPREKSFIQSKISPGLDWGERYDKLYASLGYEILSEDEELPNWLRMKTDYSIFKRANSWLLQKALVNGEQYLNVVTLSGNQYSIKSEDTFNLIKYARSQGAKIIEIDVASS